MPVSSTGITPPPQSHHREGITFRVRVRVLRGGRGTGEWVSGPHERRGYLHTTMSDALLALIFNIVFLDGGGGTPRRSISF